MVYCGVLSLCRSTRGFEVRRVLCTACAILIIASQSGCGSDEPALKEMTEAERQAQVQSSMEYQKKAQESGSGNKNYQDSMKNKK